MYNQRSNIGKYEKKKKEGRLGDPKISVPSQLSNSAKTPSHTTFRRTIQRLIIYAKHTTDITLHCWPSFRYAKQKCAIRTINKFNNLRLNYENIKFYKKNIENIIHVLFFFILFEIIIIFLQINRRTLRLALS